MVSGVGKKAGATVEYILPEFGKVDLSWFDPAKKYRGALFKLSPEAAKQICEIVQFSANFEFSGIRTAVMDLMKTEGFCLLEIERNTKPTDIASRYSRERWEMLDAGKTDNLRPWMKAEFDAAYIPEKVIGLAAEQLRINPANAINFIIRINFKDKTFAVIGEEQYAEQMPSGGFSHFTLPTEQMIVLYEQVKSSEPTESASTASPVSAVEAVAEKSPAEPTACVQEAAPVVEPAAESESNPAADPVSEEPESPSATEQPSESSSVNEKKQEESFFKHPVAEAKKEEPEEKKSDEPLPGSTKALEKFITRKENRPEEQKQEPRRETVVEAKYATYSRSEVDSMLKQQTENIASALGSKISSQQRTFQEAVDKQEKSFAKLSDGFVSQFDQTRQRLENSSKQTEESIRAELEKFKAELSKELDQHRAQLNKSIVPVAKFIEDKNAKPEKAQKEIKAAASPSQAPSDGYGLKPLLIANLVLMLIVLGALFSSVMPDLAKMQELNRKIDSIDSRLATPSRPAASTTGGNIDSSSTSSTSTTTPSGVTTTGN